MINLKHCYKCDTDKGLEHFSKNKSECKNCQSLRDKEYYKNNRVKRIIVASKWNKNNKERYNNNVYRCISKKRKYLTKIIYTKRQYVSIVIKPKILKRDNYKCVMCLDESNLIVHHIIPIKYAPERVEDLSNLITLCRKCHRSAHDNRWNTYDPVWAELATERNLKYA